MEQKREKEKSMIYKNDRKKNTREDTQLHTLYGG